MLQAEPSVSRWREGEGCTRSEDRGRIASSAALRVLHRIGSHDRHLIGVGREGVERAAEAEVRRVGARGEQELEEGEDLLVGEALALDLGGRQRRDEVVAGLAAALVEDRRDELGELPRAFERVIAQCWTSRHLPSAATADLRHQSGAAGRAAG